MAENILRLRVDSQEYDAKLKKAAEGIRHLAEVAHRGGGELTGLEKAELDYVKGLGSMETKSRTASGSVRELESTFKELTVVYNHLNDVEKQDEGGKALRASLDQIKQRAQEARAELDNASKSLGNAGIGNFGNIIDGIGHKMGITANLTELVTSRTALMTAGMGASVAAVTKATEAWASYNAELAKQDQITTVTTGLKGDDANRMTDQARALTDTYGVDFREAINAANTLMTQFGQTGEQAMSLIRDGMQGMIQGDGPKLLSMIQQYAPAFRDAGVSASQLVAVIQNSEGGIFTDQNMNAIVMGIKNIRLMTSATSEALGKLGIDGQQMSQQLRDGSLTIFDALKQVATQIQGVNSNSQAAGEVMQQVFGRQGAMAGTKLGEAIATLNTNLEETKRQTGEVGKAYDDLYKANEKLNKAIRDCFEYDGWDQMATGIKANLVNALAVVLESCKSIYDKLSDIGALNVFDFIASSVLRCVEPFRLLYEYAKKLFAELGGGSNTPEPKENKPAKGPDGAYYETKDASGKVIERGHWKNGKTVKDVTEDKSEETKPLPGKPTRTKIGSGSRNQQTELQQNQARINTLTQEYVRLGDETTEAARQRQEEIRKEIALLEKRNGLLGIRAEQAKGKFLGNEGLNVQDEFQKIKRGGIGSSFGILPTMEETLRQRGGNLLDDKAMKAVNDGIYGDTGKKGEKNSAKSLLNGISQLTDGLQKIGIDIPEEVQAVIGVIQGVMQVIEAVNTIIGVTQTTALTANTAAIISLEAAIWANTAASAIPFANGGVVRAAGGTVVGNTYSGDQIPALLNAGEVVLNRSQVSTLASQLQGSGAQNMKLEATVSGEQLRFVLNNNGRRTGRGEYVQSTKRS